MRFGFWMVQLGGIWSCARCSSELSIKQVGSHMIESKYKQVLKHLIPLPVSE